MKLCTNPLISYFSGVNVGFMIFERDNIDNWEELAAVALTCLDILNPIEAVVACCWSKLAEKVLYVNYEYS